MKKETLKAVNKAFYDFRIAAKTYIYELRFPTRRNLLSVEAADAQGKLNGMTVVEMLTVVNLTAMTGERIELIANGKTITFQAVKTPAPRSL